MKLKHILLSFMVITSAYTESNQVHSIRLNNVGNKCVLEEIVTGKNKTVEIFRRIPKEKLRCEITISKQDFEKKYKYCVLTGFDESHTKGSREELYVRHFFNGKKYIFEWSNMPFVYYSCIGR